MPATKTVKFKKQFLSFFGELGKESKMHKQYTYAYKTVV